MNLRLPDTLSRLRATARAVSVATAVCFCVPGQASDDANASLPLPQWSPDEIEVLESQGGPPGLGILLPRDPTHLRSMGDAAGWLNPGPRLADGPPAVFPEGRGLLPQDMALFLPDSILRSYQSAHPAPSPTPATSLRDVTPEFLAVCNESPANEYLLDPQGLVPEVAGEHIQRFLEFHAHDARIRAYVLVLDRNQKLPAYAQPDRIACGSLAKGASCLLVYPLGEPWRARLFLSKPVYATTTHAYLADLAADCVKDALLTNDAEEQLHRFAVRLSTRLFWLEKASARNLPAKQPASLQEVIPEVANTSPIAAGTAIDGSHMGLGGLVIIVLLIVGTLSSAAFGVKRLQTRHAQRHLRRVWILPDPEVSHRLGGAFCGGSGASTTYKA